MLDLGCLIGDLDVKFGNGSGRWMHRGKLEIEAVGDGVEDVDSLSLYIPAGMWIRARFRATDLRTNIIAVQQVRMLPISDQGNKTLARMGTGYLQCEVSSIHVSIRNIVRCPMQQCLVRRQVRVHGPKLGITAHGSHRSRTRSSAITVRNAG